MGKIDVYKDRDLLEITVKWFSPKAYFMLFFTAFWNGFLLVWYSIAFSSGGPLAMKLFPIFHVLVGLFLLYYTICIFFNKTYVDVIEDELIVDHKPLPWFKGKKNIPTREIEQLYVKESVSHSRNGQPQPKYVLRAKLFDKSDQKIIDISSIPSEKLLEVESHLEDFIGIDDKHVRGEYGRMAAHETYRTPRKHRADRIHSPLASYYNLSKGNLLNLNGKGFVIMDIVQYDWKDRQSDKLFKISDLDSNESEIFFFHVSKNIDAYQLSPVQKWFDASFIDNTAIKSELYLNGISFHLAFTDQGLQYQNSPDRTKSMRQWIYTSDDKKYLLRIFDANDGHDYQIGEMIPYASFNDVLDLNVDFKREEVVLKSKQDRS